MKRDGMLLKEQRKLTKLVGKYLVSIGARPATRPGGIVEYRLDTPVGVLGVCPYGDWIACWFEEPERAVAAAIPSFGTFIQLFRVPLNAYSGKWNHHFFERVTAIEALESFRRAVEQVLRLEVVDAKGVL